MMMEEASFPLITKGQHYVEVWRKGKCFHQKLHLRKYRSTCGKIKALKTFMDIAIAQEDTLFGSKLKLV
jgi:hypothetical protein